MKQKVDRSELKEENILKHKSAAPLNVKIHIKTSGGWILFKFSHKIILCVYNILTKLHDLVIDNFDINRHHITRSSIFRFQVSKPLLTHDSL